MRREIPNHLKGYRNEWGAIINLQDEVQKKIEEEEKQEELEKKRLLKEELDAQMTEVKMRQLVRDKERQNPEERKTLENNYKVLKNVLYVQMEQEQQKHKFEQFKERNINLMKETQQDRQKRMEIEKEAVDMEKKLHNIIVQKGLANEKQEHEDKRKIRENQKADMIKFCEEQKQMKNKQKEQEKEYDKIYDNFHQDLLKDREMQSKRFYDGKKEYYQNLLQLRARVQAPNFNDTQKQQTMLEMQKQYEERIRQQELQKQEVEKQKQKKVHQNQEELLLQVFERNRNQELKTLQDKDYAYRVNNDFEKFKHEIEENQNSKKTQKQKYADELRQQIKKDQERKIKDQEMSPRERMLNMGGINAYMSGNKELNTKLLPGFQRNNPAQIQQYIRSSFSRSQASRGIPSTYKKSFDSKRVEEIIKEQEASQQKPDLQGLIGDLRRGQINHSEMIVDQRATEEYLPNINRGSRNTIQGQNVNKSLDFQSKYTQIKDIFNRRADTNLPSNRDVGQRSQNNIHQIQTHREINPPSETFEQFKMNDLINKHSTPKDEANYQHSIKNENSPIEKPNIQENKKFIQNPENDYMKMVNTRSPESVSKRFHIESNSILSLNRQLDEQVRNSLQRSAFRQKGTEKSQERMMNEEVPYQNGFPAAGRPYRRERNTNII